MNASSTNTKPQDNSRPLLPAFPEKISTGFLAANLVSLGFWLICLKTCLMDFGDAETALAFYGTYHREPMNQFIHFVGVPIILWTLIICSSHLVLPGSLLVKIPGIQPHYCTMAVPWVLLYAAFYLSVDAVGTLLYAPLLYAYYATAVRWTANDQAVSVENSKDKKPSWMGTGKLLRWSSILHFLSWYVQIHPGHKIVEGASPAVMANVGGALVAAPLFAFYEGVWFLGLRQGLHGRIQELIAQYTQELCSQGAAMRVCESL